MEDIAPRAFDRYVARFAELSSKLMTEIKGILSEVSSSSDETNRVY
jgi:hypothetical protein